MSSAQAIVLPGHFGADHSLIFDGLAGDPPDGRRYLRNVTVPTLTPYLPDRDSRTGTGVIVAPGGALHFLSVDNEGAWVAERLTERGVAAFVLHYRVTPTPVSAEDFAMLGQQVFTNREAMARIGATSRVPAAQDGAAGMQLVREHAAEWGVDPDRVGMLGFSAGAFVTAVSALDVPDLRPAFVGLIYPPLWGDLVVPEPAPPMFLAWASNDELGEEIIGSALRIYEAWWRAGAAVEAHAYASGGHGFGITPRGSASDRWFADFSAWLNALGF